MLKQMMDECVFHSSTIRDSRFYNSLKSVNFNEVLKFVKNSLAIFGLWRFSKKVTSHNKM